MQHLYRPPSWHPAPRRAWVPSKTSTLAGFDFDTETGLIFADLAGGLVGLTREANVDVVLRVYAESDLDTLLHKSGTLTTGSNGRLARYTHASLTLGNWYQVTATRLSDGEPVSTRIQAT